MYNRGCQKCPQFCEFEVASANLILSNVQFSDLFQTFLAVLKESLSIHRLTNGFFILKTYHLDYTEA